MRTFGLIGYPLSHSFSPGYFKEKFEKEQIDAVYKLFPLKQLSEFPGLISKYPELCGLNVTIPYKEQILSYLDSVSEEAQKIGSVNTIAFNRIQKPIQLMGFNTDVYGFEKSLKPQLKNYHNKAMILGTGGSSKAVSFVLNKLGIQHVFVSRDKRKNPNTLSYKQLTTEIIYNHRILVNTTPVGMYPNISEKPEIPYDGITQKHLLYDLIYNPSLTSFLHEGERRGADVVNGLNMLQLQAEESWTIWNKYIS